MLHLFLVIILKVSWWGPILSDHNKLNITINNKYIISTERKFKGLKKVLIYMGFMLWLKCA